MHMFSLISNIHTIAVSYFEDSIIFYIRLTSHGNRPVQSIYNNISLCFLLAEEHQVIFQTFYPMELTGGNVQCYGKCMLDIEGIKEEFLLSC